MKNKFQVPSFKFRVVAVIAVVAVALLMSGCAAKKPIDPNVVPAAETTMHKLLRGNAAAAAGLNEIEGAAEDGFRLRQLGESEAVQIVVLARDGSKASDEFNARLRSLATVDPSNQAQVISWARECLTSIRKLHDEGVTRIKSADARAKFDLLWAAVDGALAVIESALPTGGISDARADHVFTLARGAWSEVCAGSETPGWYYGRSIACLYRRQEPGHPATRRSVLAAGRRSQGLGAERVAG